LSLSFLVIMLKCIKYTIAITVNPYILAILFVCNRDGHGCRDDLITLAFDVLSGLAHMNSFNLVHRNLSLDNILFDSAVS